MMHCGKFKLNLSHIYMTYTTGLVKEKLGGKSYAVYSIQVTEISISGIAADRQWLTTRRYSDFYDLYVIVSDKVRKSGRLLAWRL